MTATEVMQVYRDARYAYERERERRLYEAFERQNRRMYELLALAQTGPKITIPNSWIPIPPLTSPDLTPEPQPEKSPIDREIEKMMERRKAKREGAGGFEVHPEDRDAARRINEHAKQVKDGEALDRALSKSFIHHTPITERLAPWKVVRG